MRLATQSLAAIILGLFFLAPVATADVESARKYLDQATEKVKNGDFKAADTTLELAEAELEGVAADAAGPVKQQIDALRKQIAGAGNAKEKEKLVREIENAIKNIQRNIEEQRFMDADSSARQLEEALNDPANKAILGDDAATYLKQLAPLRKVASNRMLGDKLTDIEDRMKRVEGEWPKLISEVQGKDGEGARQNSTRSGADDLDRLNKMIAELPADNEKVKALQGRYDKLQKEYTAATSQGGLAREIDDVDSRLKRAEEDWPELMNTIKDLERSGPADSAARDAYGRLESLDKFIQELPADNDAVKSMAARYAKLKGEFDSVYASASTGRVVDQLTRYWDDNKSKWEGWEQETAGPSLEDYAMKGGASDESKFKMGKTTELRQFADRFLEELNSNESYKEVANDPKVKTIVDNVKKQRDEAYAKLVKVTTTLMEEAEKATMDDSKLRAVQYMDFPLNNALGQESAEAKALNTRREAILKKNEEAVAAGKAAKEAAYKKMEEAAGKAWPDMAAKFDAQDGFDPDSPPVGKYVRLRGIDNRMGGQFASDEFPFATKINGKPVAGRFDPVVVAALDACEEKFGYRSYPSEWDVIAMVERGTARINEVTTNEVRDSGGSRVGSFDRSTPVEAPIIKIVAIHAGPVAAAAGAGAMKEDGKVEAPGKGAEASSGSTGSSALSSGGAASAAVGSARAWFMRLLVLVVGLAAAAACLMKANYAPLASIPQAGQVSTRIGGENLAMIGLICAGLGVLFLLLGFVYRGMFTNLAIIAAGLYAALDFFQARNIVTAEQAAQVRPFGVPIGLTCAALVIVSLLLGLIGVNLRVI